MARLDPNSGVEPDSGGDQGLSEENGPNRGAGLDLIGLGCCDEGLDPGRVASPGGGGGPKPRRTKRKRRAPQKLGEWVGRLRVGNE